MDELIKNVEKARAFELAETVEVEQGCVASLTLSQEPGCKMTVFAIDTDEGLSSHAAQGDAFLLGLAGSAEIVVDGATQVLHAGEALVIPTLAPHSVHALEPFKMLLVVVKRA